MKLEQGKIKRIAVYSLYDKDGIVDRYVEYFLNDLLENVERIIIICNGILKPQGRQTLKKYGDIIVRENEGFDIWGYKTGLDFIGWEQLRAYDEVVVCNNTMMGPIYPFKDMFFEMQTKNLDFWGITRHYSIPFNAFGCCPYGYVPEHIQSNFVVFRSSLVQSYEFKNYWKNLPLLKTYYDAIGKHESYFTKFFGDKGFLWDTYVYTDDLKEITDYPLMNCTKELIQNRKCPIFKRRSFFQPYSYLMYHTTGQAPMELYDYLQENTNYKVDMIWENLLRTCNQADLAKNLHLNYTLPSDKCNYEFVESILKNKKIALVMHLYFEDLTDSSLLYAMSMPECSDIYVTTDTEKKKKTIEKKFIKLKCNHLEIRVIENRGRDVSSLLVGVKDIVDKYEYICFVHDKKTAQVKPGSVGESFAYKCFENTLHNQNFVYNVIELFEKNPRLGILSPPAPNHSDFFPTIGLEWGVNFENSKELALNLGFNIPMSRACEPIAPLGTFFWFRSKALLPLFKKNWRYEDFPEEPNGVDGTLLHAIERIYPFAAQESGYYPGILMVDKFARIEYTNLLYYVRAYNEVLVRNNMCSYQDIMVERVEEKLKKNQELVGYINEMTGDKEKMQEYINHLEGVVQDLYPKTSIKFQIKDRIRRLFRL